MSWQSYVDFVKSRGNIDEVMIVDGETGALFATSNAESFFLRKYSAVITQEDGSERNETVDEASNLVKFMKGQTPSQGLRINGQKKHQITRNFKDEQTGHCVIFSKFPQGGACVANAGKCILIATFSEAKGHASPACNETITLLAMYLAKSVWPNKDDAGGGSTSASWNSYIDLMLVGKGSIAQAMIISSKDGNILTSTIDFKEDGTDRNETVDETKNLLSVKERCAVALSNCSQLMQSKVKSPQGLRINQVKYQIIRQAEDENSACYSVYGKKTMGGCGIVDCGKCIVIATFDETKQHTSQAMSVVLSDLAKYLKGSMK